VLDSADLSRVQEAKQEMAQLLDKPLIAGIPLLVLGNKNDLPNALTVDQIISEMYCLCANVRDLNSIHDRPVSCYSISAKNNINIDLTLQLLTKNA
jgi:ADP-ribosylation factor-like protein 8